jgi:hypothetical protein
MTVGNINKTLSSHTMQIVYATINRVSGVVTYTNQGLDTANVTSARVWNGADRVLAKPIRPKPQGLRRTYTIPVNVKTKRGKQKVISVKRSFFERPIPSRVERDLKNAPHAYTVTYTQYSDVHTRWFYPKALSGQIWGDMSVTRVSGWPTWSGVNTPPVLDANDQLKLIGKLKAQIRGSDFNLAVFLGEGHETVKMITSTAVKLAMAGMMARKGRFADAARHLTDARGSQFFGRARKTGANSWLELQYGWLPLLQDVKSGAEQLAHILHYPKTKTYRAQIRKRINYVATLFGWNWADAHATVSRQIIAHITEPESTLSTLGLLDPELVAWELLPFSFVADWFIPVGDYLEARAFSRHISGTFVTTDISRKFCRNITSQRRDVSEPAGHSVAANTASSTITSLTRSVSTTLAVPLPAVKPVGKALSWGHMLNAVALVSQVFKGSGPDKALDRKISAAQKRSNDAWKDAVVKAERRNPSQIQPRVKPTVWDDVHALF